MEVEVDDERGCVLSLLRSENSNLEEDEFPSKDIVLESHVSDNIWQ
jgi:hypothetical protein